MKDIIKTRAPKAKEAWRTVSIPESFYSRLLKMSQERGQSISLLARQALSQFFGV